MIDPPNVNLRNPGNQMSGNVRFSQRLPPRFFMFHVFMFHVAPDPQRTRFGRGFLSNECPARPSTTDPDRIYITTAPARHSFSDTPHPRSSVRLRFHPLLRAPSRRMRNEPTTLPLPPRHPLDALRRFVLRIVHRLRHRERLHLPRR